MASVLEIKIKVEGKTTGCRSHFYAILILGLCQINWPLPVRRLGQA